MVLRQRGGDTASRVVASIVPSIKDCQIDVSLTTLDLTAVVPSNGSL